MNQVLNLPGPSINGTHWEISDKSTYESSHKRWLILLMKHLNSNQFPFKTINVINNFCRDWKIVVIICDGWYTRDGFSPTRFLGLSVSPKNKGGYISFSSFSPLSIYTLQVGSCCKSSLKSCNLPQFGTLIKLCGPLFYFCNIFPPQ